MFQKGLAPIFIIVFIALVLGGYLIYSGKIALPQKQVACTLESKMCPDGSTVGRAGPKCEFSVCPSPKADKTANWKTYTIQKIAFSMQYPPDWQLVEKKYDESDQEVTFSGIEGKISFKMGTGFGGGCPMPTRVKISGQEFPACQSENGQRISFGKETNIPLNLGNGVTGKLSIQVDSDITFPIQSNQKMIMDILSTFKFSEQDSSGQSSVEGKFCGGLGGNLPENQCPIGYKCELDGNYPDVGGKCIKE